jgi:GT2 family glycosyltransferase
MPTVSVQIVTFNSEKDIKKCLDGVFSQSYPIQKVIIIDNQSVDRTLQIVEGFDNIYVIKNAFNNGFAGGHNQGIRGSDAEYVLVLNPDVQLQKDYIEKVIIEMELNTHIGMATGKLYRDMHQHVLDSTGIIMKRNRRAFDRGAGQTDSGQYDEAQEVFGVSGAAAVFRRKMIKDISIDGEFFDETFFAYKEDVDVSWRAQLLGWKSLFVPSAIAEHGRGWQEEKKRSDVPLFIRQKSYINRYFYILKNDNSSSFIFNFPIILMYEILSFSYALLKERQLLVAWKSFRSEYKQMLEKRRVTMRKRRSTKEDIHTHFKGIW